MEESNQAYLETGVAAAQLAARTNYTAQEIELALRTIGYLEVVPGLVSTLQNAARLRSRFLAIENALPNLGVVTRSFLIAADLSELAHQINDIEPRSIEARRKNENLDGLGSDPFRKWELPLSTDVDADICALFWVVEAIRVLCNGCFHTLDSSGWKIVSFLQTSPSNDLVLVNEGFERTGLKHWLEAVCRHTTANADGFSIKFHHIACLFGDLEKLELGRANVPSCLPPRPQVVLLEHRELSQSHWNALRPREHELLKEYLEGQTEPIERLVISLALATGRSIRDVLSLHVCGHLSKPAKAGKQYVQLSLMPSYKGYSFRATWHIPTTNGDSFKLALPIQITGQIRNLIKPETNTTLIKRLPVTVESWEARCTRAIMTVLGTRRLRANLLIRDTLSRSCYEASNNPALSYWLSIERREEKRLPPISQVALAYYLNPKSERVAKVYQEACQKIFGKYGSFEKSILEPNGNFGVKIEAHRGCAEALRKRIEEATKSQDPIKIHNSFAQYTLLLLIAATGHRKSTAPFGFSWDLILEEDLAFIADKCIVGSEARIIPLSQVAVAQAKAYFRHLLKLHKKLGNEYSAARNHISNLINAEGSRGRPPSNLIDTGLFFDINADGSIKTVSTGDISSTLKLEGFQLNIGDFRKALADALWGKGCSGYEVAALLGHANTLHPFGPGSSWSVKQWASKIRPLIDEYMAERGWSLFESPLMTPKSQSPLPSIRMPSPQPGRFSYEGRRRERLNAEVRASFAIRSVFTDDLIEQQGFAIDDDVVRVIREEVDLLLGADEEAKKYVNVVLAQKLQQVRKTGVKVNSILFNRYRFEPSPIQLEFGRRLAIAKKFRAEWIARLGTPIGGKLDRLERVAQLGISLIVFDAMLNPQCLANFIDELVAGRVDCRYQDAVTVRVKMATRAYEFDSVRVVSDITTAYLLGLEVKQIQEEHAHIDSKAVTKRIDAICMKLMGREGGTHERWTLKRLAETFEPWWFLRLNGAMYSIATGRHNGPAAHAHSEASLFANEERRPAATPFSRQQELSPEIAIPAAHEAAWSEIRKLLSNAAGQLEAGTANSRNQRQQLKALLRKDISNDLTGWRQIQQVVDYLMGFTQSLLEEGGLRRSKLTFSSIRTYLETISRPLVKYGWDKNFHEMDVSEYRDLYREIELDCVGKKTDWRLVLHMFHQFLRNTIGAPLIPEMESGGSRLKKCCRGSLITAEALKIAEGYLSNSSQLLPEQKTASRVLMYSSIGYGCRLTEAAGLSVNDFDSVKSTCLAIRANVIRDLKNRRRGRVVHQSMLKTSQLRIIESRKKAVNLSPADDKFLLESPQRDQKIVSISPLTNAITAALRISSSNESVVFHDLRHTFATSLTLAGSPMRSGHPALNRAAERMLGGVNSDNDFARQITGTTSDSPFFYEDIAQVLGHANVDTLFNVYCHASSLLLADVAYSVNLDVQLDDARLASILGKDRTAIVKIRSRMAKQQRGTDTASLIRHYLAKGNKSISHGNVISAQDHPQQLEAKTEFSPVMFDRLLCHRKSIGLELRDLQALGEEQGIASAVLNDVFVRYRHLVLELGFDDFEPEGSELVHASPKRSNGVLRASQERQAALQTISEMAQKDESFSQALCAVAERWEATVDSKKPVLVCKDSNEFKELFLVLKALGVVDEQLVFDICGSVQSVLAVELAKKYSIQAFSGGRFSRGPQNARVEEVGISIRQLAGSKIPDGRDFHRMIAVALCCLG